ncbi:MAG: hypothetical protein EHM17_02870 [Verrucomicrobiaceae bacterium]|nr:MAG: hypothetical protein EHM17_02870 [Verrucomicrobiaceae bacterium]
MNFRSIFPLMLLAMQSALPGRDAGARMRLGDEALAAGLWEMAALHFDECLAENSLKPEEKSGVAIRLAEAWIRDGKPAEALALLGESFVSSHPEAPFWKGQALAGLGRFGEALDVLAPLLQDRASPFPSEAAFTVTNLQLALGKPESAMETLDFLASKADAALAAKARLHQVEILLDARKTAKARKIMPDAAAFATADRSLAALLEAQLLLAEGRPADAASVFQSLIDQLQGQSLERHHLAAVGLADTFLARKNPDAASAFLLAFIQANPDSPCLDALFQRLLDAMPASPAVSDPILAKLTEWITPPEFPATGLLVAADSAAGAWPMPGATGELIVHALFTRALGLQRMATPEAAAEARQMLTRLRLSFPEHPLAGRALFESARKALATGEDARAFSMLESLRESSAALRGEAAFLEAKRAFSKGDKARAASLFEEAARSLAENEAKTARFNAAILQLVKTDGNPGPQDPALAADLMLERALSQEDPAAKRAAIEEFLIQHTEHPRVPEARLAAAEAALASGPEVDLSFARAQLETLAAEPEKSATLNPSRLALVRLRIDDLSQQPAAAIATARQILEQFPAEPAAAEAALVLGRNLFQSSSYNEARMVLEKLAASDSDPARAEAAWLLAARSAALIPASQSQQEALALFEKVIALNRPLASIAMLEKARLMIDMNRLMEAAAFLRQWLDSLEKNDPLYLPAGFLLGEAIYGQGGTHPESLTEALAVYDRLLASEPAQPGARHRLQYLRGRTLEQIPDAKDPSRKREREAFIAYYSVLETETPPEEWHYFELCGFRALALLEKAGRWPAAIACARKIASFNGPRAEEAASRANQLQLKHMIWED